MMMWLVIAAATGASVAAAPERVCVDPRTGYPNVDFVFSNQTEKTRAITEMRGLVFDAKGTVLERRLVWQDALSATRPDSKIAARGTSIVFNPLPFNTASPGRRMRFEFDLDGPGAPSLSVDVTPVDCAAGQPRLILPIKGRVLVYDGYDALSHHRRSDFRGSLSDEMGITSNFQRFGIDLIKIDREGRLWRGDGKRTSDWLGWGQPVRAAAAGMIAAMHDGQPDNVVIGSVDKWGGPKKSDPMSSYGNYVLIEHGRGEFTLYGHMRLGSIQVKQGQKVAAGATIGNIGNSGASGGVHLHWERRRGQGFGLAGIETQPAYVQSVELVGSRVKSPPTGLAINTGDVLISR